MGALSAAQPALGTLIALIGAVGAIVHALIAPLSVKMDNVENKVKELKADIANVEKELKVNIDNVEKELKADINHLESKMTAEFKEIKADINQLLIAFVRSEAQRDNSASGRKPGR
jgi:outer membrane murein-binding lipoprotein Lpp